MKGRLAAGEWPGGRQAPLQAEASGHPSLPVGSSGRSVAGGAHGPQQ